MAKDPTRVPVKTRLAATVGDEVASELYRAFIMDEVTELEAAGLDVLVSLFPPGDGKAFREWLGIPVATLPQEGKDLGERIISSLSEAGRVATGPVVTMTSDVPDLPADHVLDALAMLDSADAVMASSSDGGFHLVGIRPDALTGDLLAAVPWSTGNAMASVEGRLRERGLQVVTIDPWHDVDDGEDLEELGARMDRDASSAPRTAEVLRGTALADRPVPWLSVVVPVLQEEEAIGAFLDHTLAVLKPGEVDLIVVDGDPEGSTLAAIEHEGVVGLKSGRGRGVQMNAGAARARGEVLLFLHVDTWLPEGAGELIRSALASGASDVGASDVGASDVGASDVGAFDVSYGEGNRVELMMAKLGNFRARLRRVPYGEHGLFMTRAAFDHLGGFPDVPIMEDVEMMLRVKRSGREVVFVDAPVNTSVRRFRQVGFWRTNARNMAMLWLHRFGLPPEKLALFYPPQAEERRRWDWRPLLRRGKARSPPR